MSEPFIGEIRIFAEDFVPTGWAPCDGQLLPIKQYEVLFTILGTTYGGDGKVTFALPDLRGRTPFHVGGSLAYGQAGGEESHTLSVAEMPAHAHAVIASGDAADSASPAGAYWANSGLNANYSPAPSAAMAAEALAPAGASKPHPNLSPYLTLTFAIALVGVFPLRTF